MKLLTWHIRHGDGARLASIVEELAAYDADVIALTEYRAVPGKELRAATRECGWPYVVTAAPSGTVNAIAIDSRAPQTCSRPARPRVISCRYSHRQRDAGMANHSLVIVETD
jgi:hypothetical protein